MIINKRCISAFSPSMPYVALATKSKLIDNSFSMTSELILVNYMTEEVCSSITTELKFCKILWCEAGGKSFLTAGHENGVISIYELKDNKLVLIKSQAYMDEDITALEYLPSKAVLVAGSYRGKVIFLTLINLDKDYSLGIPLSLHITAMAWNPKVTKILCVGSVDGMIKVLDIKKNTVIMTINNKEIAEVKKLAWDTENNTKLLCMSDKGYVTVFDLSNDSVDRMGNHSEPLIGFSKNIIVSKNCIESGTAKIPIADSFDCSISLKDPVIALSSSNGDTEILAIPIMKFKIPFCRVENSILSIKSLNPTCRSINIKPVSFEIPLEDLECKQEFYIELIKKVSNGSPKDEIADFIIQNAESINHELIENAGSIDVDLDNLLTKELVKGNISALEESDLTIKLSYLLHVITHDESVMDSIEDFNVLYVLCKIFNNYKYLGKLKNPRILAAVLLYNDISDFSALSSSRESRVIKAILNQDVNEYISARIIPDSDYLKRVKSILQEADFINTNGSDKISSPAVVEYFWFKLMCGDFESIKTIPIRNSAIEYFIKSKAGLIDSIKEMKLNSSTATNYGSEKSTLFSKPDQYNQNPVIPSKPNINTSINSGLNNTNSLNSQVNNPIINPQSTKTPFYNNQINFNPSKSSSTNVAGSHVPVGFANKSTLQQNQPIIPPQNPSQIAQPYNNRYPTPPQSSFQSNQIPIHPVPKTAFQNSIPQPSNPIQQHFSKSTHDLRATNSLPNQISNPIPQPAYSNSQISFPSPPSSASQNLFTAPKIPQPPSSISSMPNTFSAIKPELMNHQNYSTPLMSSSIAGIPGIAKDTHKQSNVQQNQGYPKPFQSNADAPPPLRPSIPQNPNSSSRFPPVSPKIATGPLSMHTIGNETDILSRSHEIINNFDAFLSKLKSKAAEKNSLIIRQRKMQCLNALASYDNIDKFNLPPAILESMDLLAKRVESPDDRLKLDVDTIVESCSDCTWLKATTELIKMIY